MKMNGYLNEFCKSIKLLIKKGKYKESIQKVQKFIQRQKYFHNFLDQTVIQLLYKQTYCCHKLILKELMQPKQHYNRYLIKQLFKIGCRNVAIVYKILLNNIKNRQVIINFECQYTFYENQVDRSNPKISEKTFSQFLQMVIWFVKNSSLVLFIKKDDTKINQLLQVAILFIGSIENTLNKKKIRFRINELQVKSLYMVHLFRSKQYQAGSQVCQKNSTQIFQLVSLLTHKNQSSPTAQQQKRYRKAIRKCYRLLLMTSLYQSYFHIALGTFHPIQALTSIIMRIQGVQGPKQFIKRYENYRRIMDILKVINKTHYQFLRYFGNSEILSIQAINNIVQNGQIFKKSILKKEKNIKSNKKSFISKKNSQILKGQLHLFNKNSKKQANRVSKSYHRNQEINKFLLDRVEEEKQAAQSERKNEKVQYLINSPKNYTDILVNQNNKVRNSILEQKDEKNRICLKKQSKSLNQLWTCTDNNDSYFSKLINKQLVSLYQNTFQENFKNKKIYLNKKKLQNKNTKQICQYSNKQSETLDFQSEKNRLWGQFKQSVKQKQKQMLRQSKIQFSTQADQIYTQNKDQSFNQQQKIIKFNHKKSFTRTTRASRDSGTQERRKIVFSIVQLQRQRYNPAQKLKTETIFEKFIKILIKNRNNLSITSFASKYESHIKKMENQRIKEIQIAKIRRQNSIKKILTQKQLLNPIFIHNNLQQKPKLKINKLSINKMRSQNIILQKSSKSQMPKNMEKQIWQNIYNNNKKSKFMHNNYVQKQQNEQFQNHLMNLSKEIKKKNEGKFEKIPEQNTKKCKYISKYSKIRGDIKVFDQQYEKKLQICYKKSRQSIDDIRGKLMGQQNRLNNRCQKRKQLPFV